MRQNSSAPEWLSKVLADKADSPKLYKWTARDQARSKDGVPEADTAVEKRTSDSKERIYVVGMGNLGRLFAAALARMPNPPPVTLVVHRPGLLDAWNDKPGLRLHAQSYLKDEHGSEPIVDVGVELWSENSNGKLESEIAPIANLVVATKAQDALPTVDRLRRYLGPDSTVAFTQNGMNKLWPPYGAIYDVARYPDRTNPNWVACVVTHGVFSLGLFESVHASPADVVLGSVNHTKTEQPYLVQKLMEASMLNSRHVSQPELWLMQVEKLVVNSVINPLTAILRCKNGYLFGYEDGLTDNLESRQGAVMRGVIDQLLKEASTILARLAQEETKDGGVLNGVDASEVVERLSFERLRAMVYRIGGVVRDNTSSMLQDVNAGKGTEVREFNGWIIDMARYLEGRPGSTDKLDVSTHQMMVELVEDGQHLDKEQLGGIQ